MNEQSKSAQRRKNDWAFVNRYFVGDGIDVGCGQDSLNRTKHLFPYITSVTEFDRQHGDAQTMVASPVPLPAGKLISAQIPDCTFDFFHASHVLEHLKEPMHALAQWARVIRPGGHLIITVPDWDMYERNHWPSKFSPEHLTCWSLSYNQEIQRNANAGRPIRLLSAWAIATLLELSTSVERVALIRDHFDPAIMTDQTLGPAECAIEIVLRKL